MSDQPASREPNDDDRFALYAHAHADLWWAKTQQWNAANWALLVIAGIVGAARSLIPSAEVVPTRTWPFVALVAVMGVAAGWYLSALHQNIVHSRKVYRAIEKETGVGKLRTLIPKAAGEETDRERGSGFLYVMSAAIGLAAGLATQLLGMPIGVSIGVGGGVAVIDTVMIARAT